jgi:hypothetical protein
MFKVSIVRGDKGEVPLSSRGGNPGIGRRDRPASYTALGHDVGPSHTGILIRKQRRAEIDMACQLLAPP